MKKNKLLKFEIISSIFIMILGVILHFTYDWSNNNPLIGIFSAINESTWEHLKLIFFPMLITTIIGHFYFKEEYPNYICAKVKGLLIALSFIVIFFYTYKGILGFNIGIINILSFFVAIILGQYYAFKTINNHTVCNKYIAIIILVILTFCFTIFSFYPPNIGLFQEPNTCMFKPN